MLFLIKIIYSWKLKVTHIAKSDNLQFSSVSIQYVIIVKRAFFRFRNRAFFGTRLWNFPTSGESFQQSSTNGKSLKRTFLIFHFCCIWLTRAKLFHHILSTCSTLHYMMQKINLWRTYVVERRRRRKSQLHFLALYH